MGRHNVFAALTTLAVFAGVAVSSKTFGQTANKAAGEAEAGSVSRQAEIPGSDRSYYLAVRDGTRLAISLYFPEGREPERAAPAILVQTRYGRAQMFANGDNGGFYQTLRNAGYVVVMVDTRGSTSSFGARSEELGPEEVGDMDELIAHIAKANWSNGEVFATGLSYMATAADVATSRAAPALKGAIIRHPDFDNFLSFQRPGGVAGDRVLERWSRAIFKMDMGRSPRPGADLDCRARVGDCASLFPMLQPVDGDSDFSLLRKALNTHIPNHWSFETFERDEFRDTGNQRGLHLMATTAASVLPGIRAQAKPVQLWASWYDGDTAEGVLARYRATPSVPMDVWITANTHTESAAADPFFPDDKAPLPSIQEQHRVMTSFLEKVRSGEAMKRRIRYYVAGSKTFKSTSVWPPEGLRSRFFSISPDQKLVEGQPAAASSWTYDVDFTAGTGDNTRWSMNPAYQDRRVKDRKLLVFDSPPFTEDMELVGNISARLHLRSTTSDPIVILYLEDVGPDGRVTYLTEGVLRAMHRKTAVRSEIPKDVGAISHSFLRRDARPMVSGRLEPLQFSLLPIAAKIRAGHRLRIAIAGADKDSFRRYSENKDESFEIVSSRRQWSGIGVQLRPWTED